MPIPLGTPCVVILFWTVVGNVYPITQAADYDPTRPPHSKFYSPPPGLPIAIKPNYAHFASVSEADGFQVPALPASATYDEIAVDNGDSMLPQYVVRFQRNY